MSAKKLLNSLKRSDRNINTNVVPINFQDDEATRRLVMHSAKRVIKQHKDEIQELAFK